MIIRASICVSDINKERIFTADNGKKYLTIALMDYKNGTNEYGNDGHVSVSMSKEERESGTMKTEFVGNWKWVKRPEGSPAPASKPSAPVARPAATSLDDDSIPF